MLEFQWNIIEKKKISFDTLPLRGLYKISWQNDLKSVSVSVNFHPICDIILLFWDSVALQKLPGARCICFSAQLELFLYWTLLDLYVPILWCFTIYDVFIIILLFIFQHLLRVL